MNQPSLDPGPTPTIGKCGQQLYCLHCGEVFESADIVSRFKTYQYRQGDSTVIEGLTDYILPCGCVLHVLIPEEKEVVH